MTMTIGEFEYDTLFRQSPGGADENDETEEIPFPEASFFLWIIFVIIMPILLSNLLVSYLITCTMMYTGAHIKYKRPTKPACPCELFCPSTLKHSFLL